MPKIPNLTKRRETWYVRLRVPSDLKEVYKTQKEITRSLKTRDSKEARKRLSQVKYEIESEFEIARRRIKAQELGGDVLSGYSERELFQLSRKWLAKKTINQKERRIRQVNVLTDEEYVNGQELAFLEAYFGTPFVNNTFTAMPSNYPESLQGQQIEVLFDSLVNRLMTSTLMQTSVHEATNDNTLWIKSQVA